MKNILITFTNAIDPTTGGVERVYHNLVPYFREHGYNVFATYQRKTDYDKNSVYTKAIFMEYSIDNVGYFDKLDNGNGCRYCNLSISKLSIVQLLFSVN